MIVFLRHNAGKYCLGLKIGVGSLEDISMDSLLVGLGKRASQADIINFRVRNCRSP